MGTSGCAVPSPAKLCLTRGPADHEARSNADSVSGSLFEPLLLLREYIHTHTPHTHTHHTHTHKHTCQHIICTVLKLI